jgi:hypothetical protein
MNRRDAIKAAVPVNVLARRIDPSAWTISVEWSDGRSCLFETDDAGKDVFCQGATRDGARMDVE